MPHEYDTVALKALFRSRSARLCVITEKKRIWSLRQLIYEAALHRQMCRAHILHFKAHCFSEALKENNEGKGSRFHNRCWRVL